MPKVSGFCRECGSAIDYWPSQDRQFCSTTCKAIHRQRVNPLPTGQKKRRGTITPCEVCAKPVYANRSERAKGAGRYCSQACHNIAQTKGVVRPCRVCGTEMRRPPSQDHIMVCSRLCESLGRIKRPLDRQYNGKPAKADNHGYIMLWEPTHPNKSLKGWQYEHRLVAEEKVGRYLRSDEQVDHINGIKNDNRPSNLQVLTAHQHSSKTALTNWKQLAEYRRKYGSPMSSKEEP